MLLRVEFSGDIFPVFGLPGVYWGPFTVIHEHLWAREYTFYGL